MPPFGPISRRELLRCLHRLGFSGPFSGGRHQFMDKGTITVFIPNPHSGDIGRQLLARLLKQAGIERSDWESL
jgi:predicted RNA binding protein YcfA (HicA-like mRNA interferase family)